jgi:hypothetical protein
MDWTKTDQSMTIEEIADPEKRRYKFDVTINTAPVGADQQFLLQQKSWTIHWP